VSDADANLAVVRRAIDASDRGDAAALRELFAADHVERPHHHQPLPLPGDDTQPTLDRYEQADANARADFPDVRTTIEEQFACGDRVVTIWTARGIHARSGTTAEVRGVSVDWVAGGKIVESWVS
jgi:ketosteroid isomerase-like protein